MENFNNINNKSHKITMTNRKTCMITGVKDVLSFDLHEVLLETEQGMLTMKGDDLHVNRLSLDQGEVDVDGRIDSLVYSETNGYGQKGESLFARLFR
jgi:sporulation protein YabP